MSKKSKKTLKKSRPKGKRPTSYGASRPSKGRAIKKSLPAPLGLTSRQTAGPKEEAETIKKTKIRVIGIGGGAGNIVSEIASRMKKASFVVANTDRQALRGTSRKAIRFHFGQNFTQGLGTGMNAELGETACQNEKEKIKKIFEDQDFSVIVACLGGGTGSGASPVFAKISKATGSITLGIFTLPFKFEGEKKMEIARASLEKLKPKLNALCIIPNERIFQIIDKTTPLKQALSAINKKLTESLEGLIETIYQPGLINIDFADFRTILQGQGRLAYLNTVEAQKRGSSVKETISKVLNCPLYPYSIRRAKGILFNIAGEKNLELAEVSQISNTISDLVSPEAKIIFGISQATPSSSRDKIKITLLASGCAPRRRPTEGRPKKRRVKKKKIKKPSPVKKKKKIIPIPQQSTQKKLKIKKIKKPPKNPALFLKRAGPTGQAKKARRRPKAAKKLKVKLLY
jgi:cell division protein FtsZ